jgi:hypothetical protein
MVSRGCPKQAAQTYLRVMPPPRRSIAAKPTKPILGPEASAELRDRLLAELSDLSSDDEMAVWAHRCLPEKSRLSATDAERVEASFQERLLAAVAAEAPPAQEAVSGGLQVHNGLEAQGRMLGTGRDRSKSRFRA